MGLAPFLNSESHHNAHTISSKNFTSQFRHSATNADVSPILFSNNNIATLAPLFKEAERGTIQNNSRASGGGSHLQQLTCNYVAGESGSQLPDKPKVSGTDFNQTFKDSSKTEQRPNSSLLGLQKQFDSGISKAQQRPNSTVPSLSNHPPWGSFHCDKKKLGKSCDICNHMKERTFVESPFFEKKFKIHGHLSHDFAPENTIRWFIYKIKDVPCNKIIVGSTQNPKRDGPITRAAAIKENQMVLAYQNILWRDVPMIQASKRKHST